MSSTQTGGGALLAKAVIWMTLALFFYSWAVFSGRRDGLQGRHLAGFAVGLLCDYLGTMQMNFYAAAFGKAPEWHNLTGLASLLGMAFHFLLALAACVAGRAQAVNRLFHRVSLGIYGCWLFAFCSGALSGMLRLKG